MSKGKLSPTTDLVPTIANWRKRAQLALAPNPFTLNDVVDMLYPQDITKAARQFARFAHNLRDGVTLACVRDSLTLYYSDNDATVPIASGYARWDRPEATPLIDYIDRVRAIYTEFEVVYAVANYMMSKASASAARYLFPGRPAACTGVLRGVRYVPDTGDAPAGAY